MDYRMNINLAGIKVTLILKFLSESLSEQVLFNQKLSHFDSDFRNYSWWDWGQIEYQGFNLGQPDAKQAPYSL